MDEAMALSIPWISENMAADTGSVPNSLVFAVTDTGVGISPEYLEKLFNKFTQFSPGAHHSANHGTGLGLVIVKGIIDAHGGTVGVGSTVGKGSTFYFTLPL